MTEPSAPPSPQPLTPSSDTTSRSAATPALHLLYVEDNRINAILFQEAMRLQGGHVVLQVAEDGKEAVAVAQSWRPDLLVLDAHLPDMSGFDLLKILRALPGLADVPACMCSADASPQDLKRAEAAGFIGYWPKPIKVSAVFADIARWAPRAPGSPDDSAHTTQSPAGH